jgi:hypothetical protein
MRTTRKPRLSVLTQLGAGLLCAGMAVVVTREVTASLMIAAISTFSAQRFQIIYQMVNEIRHRR